MSLRVVLRPEAQADLLAARRWYERQRQGLGDEFAQSVEELLDRIAKMPELCAVALWGVRCGKLRRFPYVVYYRVLADRIEVIAVLHGSRNPQVWQDRVS
jgi:plasmid stabilization system protein ParE